MTVVNKTRQRRILPNDTDSKPYGLEFDEDINMQYRCIRTETI